MRKVVSLAHEADAPADALTLAQAAAAQLLERSVFFGHRRLSVVRLNIAAQLGAALPLEHWNHCARVATVSSDPRIRALFVDALHAVQLKIGPALEGQFESLMPWLLDSEQAVRLG